MFERLIKISDRKYKAYKRHKSTIVVAIPNDYVKYRDLQKGQYLHCFYSDYQGKRLLCYSEFEISGTQAVKVSPSNKWFRLSIPKIVLNMLDHNDNCHYEAYHNSNGLLIFEQKRSGNE